LFGRNLQESHEFIPVGSGGEPNACAELDNDADPLAIAVYGVFDAAYKGRIAFAFFLGGEEADLQEILFESNKINISKRDEIELWG
jgi:hypothetical protein